MLVVVYLVVFMRPRSLSHLIGASTFAKVSSSHLWGMCCRHIATTLTHGKYTNILIRRKSTEEWWNVCVFCVVLMTAVVCQRWLLLIAILKYTGRFDLISVQTPAMPVLLASIITTFITHNTKHPTHVTIPCLLDRSDAAAALVAREVAKGRLHLPRSGSVLQLLSQPGRHRHPNLDAQEAAPVHQRRLPHQMHHAS